MSRPLTPGAWLVRLIAWLVPARERSRWRDEWEGELAWAFTNDAGATPFLRLALLARALGALPDAIEMRRSYGGDPVLAHDLRFALRALVRRPGYATLVALTLALGIGASTAVFTVVDAVLLRPLPFRDVERLVELEVRLDGGFVMPAVAPAVADAWRAEPGVLDAVAIHRSRNVVLEQGEPTDLRVVEASSDFLPLLGIAPRLGRGFTAEEARRGERVAVVSDALWRTALGADPGAVGRSILLSGERWTVIGVMPPAFRYPRGIVSLWMPLPPDATTPATPEARVAPVQAIARLAPGVALDVAQARADARAPHFAAARPDVRNWAVQLTPVGSWRANPDMRRALLVLTGAVACVLLIACANAANLLLVRATAGSRDLAVRVALGATRGQVVRGILVEAGVLALAGGVLGVLLAQVCVRVMVAMAPQELTFFAHGPIAMDARVLAFALAVSVLTVVLSGALPAVRATRRRVRLVGAERTGTGTREQRGVRGALVVAQLALSLVLLAGAGLLVASFTRLAGVAPGMDVDRLALLSVSPTAQRYASDEARASFYAAVVERIAALPGVRAVSVADGVAGGAGGIMFGTALEAEGVGAPAGGDPEILPMGGADTAYFRTLGIPLLQGRGFEAAELAGTSDVAIVDEDLARHLWPDGRAVGRRFRTDARSPWLTVVGVAGDVKLYGPDDRQHRFELYVPTPPGAAGQRMIVARTVGDPDGLLSLMKAAVHAVDPLQPVREVTTAARKYREPLVKPRFLLTLMAVFAGVAALLSAVGLYGVIAYAVTQRTREIGVRLALGANRERIVGDVVRDGARLATVGIALGLGGALLLGRFLESLLFGVSPTDPLTLAGVALAFAAVALLAAYVPARRASRIDPVVAMRAE